MAVIHGKIVVFGDDVHANQIIPIKNCITNVETELGHHCFENDNKTFDLQGKILIAGAHFGIGGVREHSVLALKGAGVKAVIAKSFFTAFFRNAVNNGLPVFQSKSTVDDIEAEVELSIDPDQQQIENLTTGEKYSYEPVPEFVARIRDAGGIQASFQSLARKES